MSIDGPAPGEERSLPGGFLPPVAPPGPPVAPRGGEPAEEPAAGPSPAPSPARAAGVVAPWGARACAAILDALLVAVVAAVVLSALEPELVQRIEEGAASLGDLALTVGAMAVGMLVYAPAVMARTNGQTFGKAAMRIRVVRDDGRPMTFGFAAFREVAVKSIGLPLASSATFGIATFADYLWPLWDRDGRALHDHVARTLVVRA